MYQSLQDRDDKAVDSNGNALAPVQRYVELDNCGHCPNHEAATLVGMIASRCTGTSQRHREKLSLMSDKDGNMDAMSVTEPWGVISGREVKDDEFSLSLIGKIITNMV